MVFNIIVSFMRYQQIPAVSIPIHHRLLFSSIALLDDADTVSMWSGVQPFHLISHLYLATRGFLDFSLLYLFQMISWLGCIVNWRCCYTSLKVFLQFLPIVTYRWLLQVFGLQCWMICLNGHRSVGNCLQTPFSYFAFPFHALIEYHVVFLEEACNSLLDEFSIYDSTYWSWINQHGEPAICLTCFTSSYLQESVVLYCFSRSYWLSGLALLIVLI